MFSLIEYTFSQQRKQRSFADQKYRNDLYNDLACHFKNDGGARDLAIRKLEKEKDRPRYLVSRYGFTKKSAQVLIHTQEINHVIRLFENIGKFKEDINDVTELLIDNGYGLHVHAHLKDLVGLKFSVAKKLFDMGFIKEGGKLAHIDSYVKAYLKKKKAVIFMDIEEEDIEGFDARKNVLEHLESFDKQTKREIILMFLQAKKTTRELSSSYPSILEIYPDLLQDTGVIKECIKCYEFFWRDEKFENNDIWGDDDIAGVFLEMFQLTKDEIFINELTSLFPHFRKISPNTASLIAKGGCSNIKEISDNLDSFSGLFQSTYAQLKNQGYGEKLLEKNPKIYPDS